MIKQYITTALKRILKNKQTSLINILGISFGLASTLIIFLWINDELNYEKCFKNAGRIAQAYLKCSQDSDFYYQTTTSPVIADRLKSNYPQVEESARLLGIDEVVIKYNDKLYLENGGCAVDPGYFNIFDYEFISGNPKAVLTHSNSMVITQSMGEKYFGDENPIHKKITINNKYEFTIEAVIKDLPKNAYRQFDFVVPFGFLTNLGKQITGSEFFPCNYITYALLHKNTDLKQLREKVEEDISSDPNAKMFFQISLQPLTDTYLIESGAKTKMPIYIGLAIFILILACINYINLSLGQLHSQQKDFGIIKINGATRFNVFFQQITESLVTIIIAFIVAMIIVRLFLGYFSEIIGKQLSMKLTDPIIILGLLGIILLTVLISGTFPSMIISSKKPIYALSNRSNRLGKQGIFKTSLTIFQFVVSILLIISTIVFNKQNRLVDNYNFGFNKNNIVYTRLDGDIKNKVRTVKEELYKNPNIVSIASSSILPNAMNSGSYFEWGIDVMNNNWIMECFVDEDYLTTFEMSMVKGRFFDPELPSDLTNSVIINEAAASILNYNDPIGKTIRYRGREFNLIGIIKNFQTYSPLNMGTAPLIMGYNNDRQNFLSIKINPLVTDLAQLHEINNYIKTTCNTLSPDRPLEFSYLSEYSYGSEQFLRSSNSIILFASILAILISCFGLFGIVYQTLVSKIKEIGIRKANGARSDEILNMITGRYVKWIVIAFCIACPLGYYGLKELLNNFAIKTDLNWWIFALSGIIVSIVSLLTICLQTIKAASRNPVEALRYE